MRTLTLEDVPDCVYDRLTARAAQNRRTVAEEALAIVVAHLGGAGVDVDKHLAAARSIRDRYGLGRTDPVDIEADKRVGRP